MTVPALVNEESSLTTEWLGMGGTLNILFQPLLRQGQLPLDQVAENLIQPGLDAAQSQTSN